ncbi:MAG: YdeI/OmpD-associated family protein [Terracidiphilus sp.]|nr:YdeI/OmpD-associated family protein [Terracidiphilus sp.]MDR3796853.1 YdeI/OmpD-associated family protein [Terracidiphilus sp.]
MANKIVRAVRKSFTVVLEPDGTDLNWTVARIPFDVAKAWPVRKGRRVRGEIEGFAFRTTLFPRPGGGEHYLLVNKKMQAGAGVQAGEKARIWLEPDLEEREILLPEELEKELNGDRRLRRWFDGLSDSMRREIGKWADEPKTPESRKKRAGKMAERLMQAMEGEQEPPPVLKAAFQRQPRAREAWFALTPAQRRNHLLGIFYYETAEGRERRAAKAIEEAVKKRGIGSSQLPIEKS